MNSLWLHSPGPPSVDGDFDWIAMLHRQARHIMISKEFLHCTYFALLFMEGTAKWYVYTALPLLAITLLAIITEWGSHD